MSETRESNVVRLLAVGGFSATLGLIGFGVALFVQIATGWLPRRALDPGYRPDALPSAETDPATLAAQATGAVPAWVAWGICGAACLLGVMLGTKLANVFLAHAAAVGRED